MATPTKKSTNEQIVATQLQRGLLSDLTAERAKEKFHKGNAERVRKAFVETLGGKVNVTLVTKLGEDGQEVGDATESGGNPGGVDWEKIARFAMDLMPELAELEDDPEFQKPDTAISLKINSKWVENPAPAQEVRSSAEVAFSNA